MADVNRGNRPLSPHLQVYRPQLTSISSIMVRITGIAILALSVIVVFWLLFAASSEQSFTAFDGLVRSFLGDLVLFGGMWALFYHMFGRLRHLIWDLGYCVDVEISSKMAIFMFVASTVLALFFAIIL
ncbi:MAG: succinate dehydrogenase, cytochrome b556 subunit [Mangrovicoccus sp.]|nr:succinate dehydrogenase, cytochrome b556 subunit [Mangrovicoccus sp.]